MPAAHPDVLRTGSGPSIGLGMQHCGAQLGPHISSLCHCRGLEQRLYRLPVWLWAPCGGKCWPVAATTVPLALRPRVSPPRNAWPAAFLFCSVVLAGAEIPASGCRDRVPGNPVPYPISYTAGFGSGSDPGPPNVPPNKPTVSQTAPYASPHLGTRVPFRRPGTERRHPGVPAEFAASPRRDERCGHAAQNWTI
jgi:hypothetical protein